MGINSLLFKFSLKVSLFSILFCVAFFLKYRSLIMELPFFSPLCLESFFVVYPLKNCLAVLYHIAQMTPQKTEYRRERVKMLELDRF